MVVAATPFLLSGDIAPDFSYNVNMVFKLFLILAVVPFIELYLLIKIGSGIGALNTILLVLLTAVIGAFMVKAEGVRVIHRIRSDIREGRVPAEELIDGAMILVAGAFLLTPGFLTDLIGFLMVIPATRRVIKRGMKRYIKRYIKGRITSFHLR
ncbi:MAG: FxsA family protein [Alphaproteobacteria bacterium]|uniref:FxsA family protein n=1 Tax=Candidatus Nitrobium versatile TaxID=2884831 RepID=A0A953M3P7_9BACT|nr:FxsA family protein [Candidatus Nitrobium versatile]